VLCSTRPAITSRTNKGGYAANSDADNISPRRLGRAFKIAEF